MGVVGEMPMLHGIPIYVTVNMREGEIYRAVDPGSIRWEADAPSGESILCAPLTAFSLTHNGHYPLESFYTHGAAEVRRERRRRAKK